MLNQDYKLIAKVIADRIKKHLDNLINHDQTGFMKGRYIGENIQNIINIMEHCNTEDISAMLVFIDFEKAFDSIDWNFMFQVLDFYNFSEQIKNWTKILYTDIKACLQNNGWLSSGFNLSRGVRQGCPLSPYLFILCVELLAEDIRMNKEIEGITVNNIEIKICQYADDTFMPLLYKEKCLAESIRSFKNFEQVSGLKINIEKTEILRIGKIKQTNCKLPGNLNIKWTNGPVKVLGVFVSTDHEEMLEINYNPKLGRIKNILQMWKQRNLTIFGKITLLKTHALSQITYLFSVLPSPSKAFFKQLETILFNFIWNNKPDKIKRSTMIAPLSEGGANMIKPELQDKALKVCWVKRLCDENNNSKWKQFIFNNLTNFGLKIWECNISKDDASKVLPKLTTAFWRDVINGWCEYNYSTPENINLGKEQIIWNNSHIKVNKTMVNFKSWQDAGIMKVKDLLDNENKFMTLDSINRKYDTNIDFLNYFSIKNAIPKYWYNECNKLTVTTIQKAPRNIQDLTKMNKISKVIYVELRNKIFTKPTSITKWEAELEIVIDQDMWNMSCNAIYINMFSTKLRTFQFKILNRILPNNINLNKMGIKDSSKCTFCKTEEETYTHLFWSCKFIKILWTRIFNWLNNITETQIEFTPAEVLLYSPIIDEIPYNMLFCLIKHHIYYCKLKDTIPNLFGTINYINHIKQIELTIAKKNNTVNKYNKRWEALEAP